MISMKINIYFEEANVKMSKKQRLSAVYGKNFHFRIV